MGIGDWGLGFGGFGVWAQPPTPTTHPPTPTPKKIFKKNI